MYGKIFETMYTGSLVGAGPTVFALMPYIVTHCNAEGYVEINPKLVSVIIGTTEDEIKHAIDYLMGEDSDSRSEEEGGRRIIQEGAFLYRVVNYAKYRALRDADTRREQTRERVKRWRQKHKECNSSVTHGNAPKRQADAAAPVTAKKKARSKSDRQSSKEGLIANEFETEFWPRVPNKIGKGKARPAYAAARGKASKEDILAGLPSYRAYEESRSNQSDYRPLHPTTWLNQERWTDEFSGDQDEWEKAGLSHCATDEELDAFFAKHPTCGAE